MSGNKYLLDTNFILALFKSNPIVIEELFSRQVYSSECFYSVVTRMELLGYPGITDGEESFIKEKLNHFTHCTLTSEIENRVIELRRKRKIKLPDAIIAATALSLKLELLTLDKHLLSVVTASREQ